MSSAQVALVVMFPGNAAPVASDVWRRCDEWLEHVHLSEQKYLVMGRRRPVQRQELAKLVHHDEIGIFEFEGELATASFRPGRSGVMLASVKLPAGPQISDFDVFVVNVASLGGALYARTCDPEYDWWQNEDRVSAYKAVGRPFAHLKLGRDEIFGEPCIDTSGHPGRWVEREGYVEALGQYMWLPQTFWKTTGANEGRVRAAYPHVEVDGLLRICLSSAPFTDANPPSEEIRRMLFPVG